MLYEIFTLNPITQISPVDLGLLYAVYFTLGILVAFPFRKFKIHKETYTVWDLIVYVPFEDGIFRAIPLMFLGRSGLIFFHLVWASLHSYTGVANMAFVLVQGILFVRLWLGGLWLLAILVHLLHDFVWVAVAQSRREDVTGLNKSPLVNSQEIPGRVM